MVTCWRHVSDVLRGDVLLFDMFRGVCCVVRAAWCVLRGVRDVCCTVMYYAVMCRMVMCW